MKFNSWRFYIVSMAVTSSAGGWSAEDIPFKYSGVHYDSSSSQYFVNDKPMFNIKPLQNGNFLDRIEFSIDDAQYAPYTGGIKFSQEGLHTLRFKAVDPVNNWSPIQSFRIFADLTRPSSKLSWEGQFFNSGEKNFISPETRLTIAANDNLSGVSRILMKKSAGAIQEYKSPHQFDKEGAYDISFLSIDNVGNAEPWQNFSFIVDSTHPSSLINLKGDMHQAKDKLFTRLGSLVELSSSDAGSGVKEIQVKINNEGPHQYVKPLALDKKFSKIQYRGIDQVGNSEKWQEFNVFVDTDAPDVNIKKIGRHQLMSGKIYARSGFQLEMNFTDMDSGVKGIMVNGQEKNLTGSNDALKFEQEGSFEVSISAMDNVGNKSAPQNFTVVIDNTAPVSRTSSEIALIEREGILYSSVPNKLSILSEDQGVGVDGIEISYDGKSFSRLQGAIDFATWKEKQRTVYYRSVDHLGNVEPHKSMVIAIRDQGPIVGLFVETEELGNIPLSEVKDKQKRNIASETPAAKKPQGQSSAKKQ